MNYVIKVNKQSNTLNVKRVTSNTTVRRVTNQVVLRKTGPRGPAGIGVPPGGAVGQFLGKSGTGDYETAWLDVPESMAIGVEVQDANPLRLLNTDENGDLADDIFQFEEISLLGGLLTGYGLQPAGIFGPDDPSFGGFDATSVGGGKIFGMFTKLNEDGVFGIVDIENNGTVANPYFFVQKQGLTNQAAILFAVGGLNNGTDFVVAPGSDGTGYMLLRNGASVNNIYNEPDLSPPNPQVSLATVYALKTYIDNIPSGSGVWGSITGNINDQADLQAEFANIQDELDEKLSITRFLTSFVDTSTTDWVYLPNPSDTLNVGVTTDSPSSISSGSSRKRVSPIVFSQPGKLTQYRLRCWVSTGSQNVRAVVYSDNAGQPDVLLAVSDEIVVSNTSEAVNVFNFSGVNQIDITAGTYHFGFINEAAGNQFLFSSNNVAGQILGNSETYATGPTNPFGAITTTNNGPLDGYATIQLLTLLSVDVKDVFVRNTGDTMTGDLNIESANPYIYLDRDDTSGTAMVRFLNNGSNEWYFGIYTGGSQNFELHRSAGGTSPFIVRYSDQFILARYGLELTYGTANTLAILDSSKNLISADTATYPSLTELARVKGVTSAIQTQLDAKLNLSGGTLTGILNLNRANNSAQIFVNQTSTAEGVTWRYGLYQTGNSNWSLHRSGFNSAEVFQARESDNFVEFGYGVDLDYSTADRIAIIDSSKHLVAANTSTYPSLTELAYLKGVSSALQTQLNAKLGASDIGVSVQAYNANLTTWAGKTAPSGTVVGTTDTQTLTDKRLTPRVGSVASSATPSINTDNVDAYSITALATAITSMTTNLSGTPTDFQKLTIRIKDNGTARAITWGAGFEARGASLPTTTVISKVLTVGFIYDTATSKWGCVASAQEA